MASKSPGDAMDRPPTGRRTPGLGSRRSSNVSDKVEQFEKAATTPEGGATGGGGGDQQKLKKKPSRSQLIVERLFRGRRTHSQEREDARRHTLPAGTAPPTTVPRSGTTTPKSQKSSARLEVAYFGRKTDARDRSSEDPRRHSIPRASLTPSKDRSPAPRGDVSEEEADGGEKSKLKLRKKSKEREIGRRASRERELEREKKRSSWRSSRSRSRERLSSVGSASGYPTPTPAEQAEFELMLQEERELEAQEAAAAAASTSSKSQIPIAGKDGRRISTERTSGIHFSRRSPSWGLTRNERAGTGIPPVPPPRTHRTSTGGALPRVSEASRERDVPGQPRKTSTPRKTPYQYWREKRLAQEEAAWGGAARKTSKTYSSYTVAPGAELEPQAGWKRERNISGVSNASSTTAEPQRKLTVHSKADTIPQKSGAESGDSDAMSTTSGRSSKDGKKKKSIQQFFTDLTKRKPSSKKEPERKFSANMLVQSMAASNPQFHANILHKEDLGSANGGPSGDVGNGSVSSPDHANPQAPSGGEEQHLAGTVLHPEKPGHRTPFQEWRHYRDGGDSRRISAPGFRGPSPGGGIRALTPDPDYDAVSVASTGSRSSYHRTKTSAETSHEDLHRQVGPAYYTGSGMRSSSSLGIPRFIHTKKSRTQSLISSSPRPDHPGQSGLPRPAAARTPSSDSFFGRHGAVLTTAESHEWYETYNKESFPHEAEFGENVTPSMEVNYDGRIHHIRGKIQ